MVKTPVGVRCPGLPVDTVEIAIGTPLRYNVARWVVRLTMSSSGPCGATSGAQRDSPGFSVSAASTTDIPAEGDQAGDGMARRMAPVAIARGIIRANLKFRLVVTARAGAGPGTVIPPLAPSLAGHGSRPRGVTAGRRGRLPASGSGACMWFRS